jgi:hypothetical protein
LVFRGGTPESRALFIQGDTIETMNSNLQNMDKFNITPKNYAKLQTLTRAALRVQNHLKEYWTVKEWLEGKSPDYTPSENSRALYHIAKYSEYEMTERIKKTGKALGLNLDWSKCHDAGISIVDDTGFPWPVPKWYK